MLFSRIVSLLVIFSVVSSSVFAQLPLPKPEPEKEKSAELEKIAIELLEQSISETAALKLPENRALIYALAGDLLWSRDEKRARSLFRGAGSEIVLAANVKTESNDALRQLNLNSGRTELFSLRQMVLRTVAERDAELALEILVTTRPTDVAAEMQTYVMPPTTPNPAQTPTTESVPRNARVEREIRLEQSLIAKAAAQDPQKAAQKIRENLEKGFSTEILAALQRMYKKDAQLATRLFDETIEKLLGADLSKNQTSMFFAVNLLRPFAFPPKENPNAKPEPQLVIDEKTARDIANKIADALLKASGSNQASFSFALPVLQKIVPERAMQLQQKQAALKKQTSPNPRPAQMPNSFNDPNATPEKLVADAFKAPAQLRGALYRQAVVRGFSGGDPERIRSLLQSQPESRERDNAIAYLDSMLATKQLQAGKTDEARKIIDRMPVGAAKAEQLVQLAVAAYRLNTKEARESAARLMNEAREMVNEFPEDKDEIDALLKVIAGYAVIEPSRAFTMLAPVIEQANEVVGAQAVLARFNKQTQFFRDGEMIIFMGFGGQNAGVFRYGKELKLLAQNDFTRTRSLLDQFRRDDVRLFARLFLAQSLLKERIGL